MAVRARYGGVPAAYEVEAPMRGYDGLLVVSGRGGAQSDVTCNNGRGGGGVLRSRKRRREEELELERYVSPPSSALLPIPGMARDEHVPPMPAVGASAAATRMVESAMASTSGRPSAAVSLLGGPPVSELWQHGAEIDALVRMECERMRAGVEQARKRQCQSLVRVVTAKVARRVREKEAEMDAARRRVADLEVRLRQAVAESQAWCGLARSNEAVAAGLRHTLDSVLRAAPAPAPAEGFGESDFTSPAAVAAAVDDAQSCCFEARNENAGSYKWACKACGEREATVLLLPCRHLCLCKACEPRHDACPVCLATKNTCVVARSATEF